MPAIVSEPRIDRYEKLIRYALKTCDAFMFLVCDYHNDPLFQERVIPFIDKLEPLLIKTRKNAQTWPGNGSSDMAFSFGRRDKYSREIRFYRCDPSALELLVQPVSLYNWQYPYFPEDLAFFRKGFCWLGSTSHEETGFILSRDEDELKLLEEEMQISFPYEEIKTDKGDRKFAIKETSEKNFGYLRYYEEYQL